jgi:hypothetical protein
LHGEKPCTKPRHLEQTTKKHKVTKRIKNKCEQRTEIKRVQKNLISKQQTTSMMIANYKHDGNHKDHEVTTSCKLSMLLEARQKPFAKMKVET